ncbi:MAG: hypothetical protein JNM56_38395 [Planctomycetia bacterium]|nr:hypothetical protein [Planctomycetia bacterium]
MPRRRILIGFGLFMVSFAAALTVFILAHPKPVIDEATKNRIRPGMTEVEVDDIIGAPEGLYTPGNFITGRKSYDVIFHFPGAAKRKRWVGEQGIILVYFDSHGKALESFFYRAKWQ